MPDSRATEFRGAVRVQISAEGKVTGAEMVKSVHPAYDQMLLRAARGWSVRARPKGRRADPDGEDGRSDGRPLPESPERTWPTKVYRLGDI